MNSKKEVLLLIVFILSLQLAFSFSEDTDNTLTGLSYSSMAWGDYDNDGQPDLLTCGTSDDGIETIAYKLNNSILTEINLNIINVTECSINWGDLNNDDFDDIVISGRYGSNDDEYITAIYTNNKNGSFTNTQNLTGIKFGYNILGDINNDNLLDIIQFGCVSGSSSASNCNTKESKVYINNQINLTRNESWDSNLTGVWKGGSALGDYDNDGDLDLILTGTTQNTQSGAVSYLYQNNGTSFVIDLINNLSGVFWGAAAFNDIDNDYDIDLVITGRNISGNKSTTIYKNDQSLISENSKPIPPNTTINYTDSKLILNWTNGSDTETPVLGLYYNIRVGSTNLSNNLVSGVFGGSSNPTQGYFGNMGQRKSHNLSIYEQCSFFQVQTIDTGFRKSNWSESIFYNSSEICDSYDNDCNSELNGTNYSSTIDEGFDKDNDGYFPYGESDSNCTGYATYDCNDNDNTSYPGSSCSRDGYTGNTINSWNDNTKICDCTGGTKTGTSGSVRSGGGGSTTSTIIPQDDTTEEIVDVVELIPTPPPKTESESSKAIDIPKKETQKEITRGNIQENSLKHSRNYYHEHGTTHIIEILNSNTIIDIYDIKATLDIPKEVIESASKIKSLDNYKIIEEDPIIEYNVELIKGNKEHRFEWVIPVIVTPENIKIKIDYDEEKADNELNEKIEQTNKVVEIKKKVRKDNKTNTTHINIDFDFKNESVLYNVTVYHEIPKCLIEFIKEEDIISKIDFEIVNEDPLIAWHFDKVVKGDSIDFGIKALSESDCDDAGETLAVAKSIFILKNKLNMGKVYLSIFIILIILSILVFFASASEKIEEDKELRDLILHAKHHYKHGGKKHELIDHFKGLGHTHETAHKAAHLNSKNKLHYFFLRLEMGVEEIIIVLILALNYFEVFGILTGDAVIVKHVISWTVLSYLLFRLSLTKLLFGVRKKLYDTIILIIFFMMILKNFVQIAILNVLETDIFQDVLTIVIRHNNILETYFFIFGIFILFLISMVFASKVDYQKPSVYSLIRMQKGKIIKTYFLLIFFFIAVYNLMFEWLAIAIDAPLTLIVSLGSIFIFIKHHKKINLTKELFKLGQSTESFYHKIIQLFQYKKMFPIAISGVLILHILADIGAYIIPLATGLKNHIYSGAGHSSALFTIFDSSHSLFESQILSLNWYDTITLFFIYISNIIFMLAVFLLPAYIWFKMYKNRKIPLSLLRPINLSRPVILTIIFTAIIFLLIPVFSFSQVHTESEIIEEGFSGLTISTHKAVSTPAFNMIAFYAALIITVVMYFILLIKEYKRIVKNTIFLGSCIFVAYYLITFLLSSVHNNFEIINNTKNIPLALSIGIILIGNIIFYSFGTILLYVELWRRREFPFEYLEIKHLSHLTHHHDMHHLHYYSVHDEFHHGDAVTYVQTYIEKSLQAGHGLLRIFEFLEEHDWPKETIREAEKKLEKTMPDLLHKHHLNLHRKEILNVLEKWVRSRLDKNTTIELITEKALDKGYSEDDMEYVFENIKIVDKIVDVE